MTYKPKGWNVSDQEAQISRKAMERMITRYNTYKKEKGKRPAYIHLEPEENNWNYITLKRFLEIRAWYWSFEKAKGKNTAQYIWIKTPEGLIPNGQLQKPPTPTPAPKPSCQVFNEQYFDKQNQHSIHSCGPTSGAMALESLGIPVSHEHMTGHYHTTMSNTNPVDIITGSIEHAAEQGVTLKGWREDFKERWTYLGELIANPKTAVILHGNTSGWPKYYLKSYGHYVTTKRVDTCTRTIDIGDPARSSILTYTFGEFLPGLTAITQPSMIILQRQ